MDGPYLQPLVGLHEGVSGLRPLLRGDVGPQDWAKHLEGRQAGTLPQRCLLATTGDWLRILLRFNPVLGVLLNQQHGVRVRVKIRWKPRRVVVDRTPQQLTIAGKPRLRASDKSAPRRSAPHKSAIPKSAPPKSAPLRSARLRSANQKLACALCRWTFRTAKTDVPQISAAQVGRR